jgi:undecaprenyl diphosphate synthase
MHIGIIPDGNRRWIKKNNLDFNLIQNKWETIFKDIIKLKKNHKYENLKDITEISLYICSIDNLKRNDNTLQFITNFIKFIYNYLKDYINSEKKKKENNDKILDFINDSKINIIGEKNLFSDDIKNIINLIESNFKNGKYTINLALGYDYNKDILNEKDKDNENYNRIQTNIDLLFRCGGEKRISGFFPTKILYSELFFIDKLFPDIKLKDLDIIIKKYKERNRRFGK